MGLVLWIQSDFSFCAKNMKDQNTGVVEALRKGEEQELEGLWLSISEQDEQTLLVRCRDAFTSKYLTMHEARSELDYVEAGRPSAKVPVVESRPEIFYLIMPAKSCAGSIDSV